MAYKLAIPLQLTNIHNVFHISMLKRQLTGPDQLVTKPKIQIEENLSYEEFSVRILGQDEKKLRGKIIPMVKIQ